jgi:hypothetical protein
MKDANESTLANQSKKTELDMKTNKLLQRCMIVAVVAIAFGACQSRSYCQETSTADDVTIAATAAYDNVTKGYEIGGYLMLAEPGGIGDGNIAVGHGALALNITGAGVSNTASGSEALYANTTGYWNTASGSAALSGNTSGFGNTATGLEALIANTTGHYNTAGGYHGLDNSTTGSNNTALGYNACLNLITGSNVTCIGSDAGPAADITGPATYIAGIYGAATTGSENPLVCIDSTGLLGTTGCASTGKTVEQQEVIKEQQVQIEELQRQNEELKGRMSRMESMIAKNSR